MHRRRRHERSGGRARGASAPPAPSLRSAAPQARRPSATTLILLLGVSAVVRVGLVFQDGSLAQRGLYVDDAYMSHKIAMNIAEGRGITQAGAATNGFQPLFVFMLVPLYLVLDMEAATWASALLCSLMSLLGAYEVFRILRKMCGHRVGMIGAALWMASSFLTRAALCGLETSLANLLMLVVLELFIRARSADGCLSAGKAALHGGVMGLAILARMDLALLVLPIAAAEVWSGWKHRRFGPPAAMLLACAVTIAPWFAWSRLACGSFMPVSGPATRTLAQLYGSPVGPTRTPNYFPLGHPPASFYASHLAAAIRHIVAETPLCQPIYTFLKVPPAASALWLAVWAAMAWAAHRKLPRDDPGARRLRRLLEATWPAWVFVALLVAAYALWCFGQWWMWRYMTPVGILLILPSALWMDAVLTWARQRLAVAGVGIVAAVVLLYAAAGIEGHRRLFGDPPAKVNEPRMFADALDLRDLLETDSRVGSFESGILDYYLGRDVVNLDGKTNAAAVRALQEGRMDRLIDELRLDYIVSSPPLLRDLLDRRGVWPDGPPPVIGRLRHNFILRVQRTEAPSTGLPARPREPAPPDAR